MPAKSPARRDTRSSLWVPDRRDIIWINFNPQVGHEMKDEHPMLVLSPKAFNDRTKIIIGLPLTHSPMNEGNPFAEKFTGPKGEACYVLCHLPSSFDWRGRAARPHPMKQAPEPLFKAVCDQLNLVIALA